jgi:hypothetical protein
LLTNVKTVAQTLKKMSKLNLILTLTLVTVLVKMIVGVNDLPMTMHLDHGSHPTQKSIVLFMILHCRMQ